MSGFDKVYNEQCARIWNQPRSENPTYKIQRAGYYGDKFMVMEMHKGWGIGVGLPTYDTREEAEQFIKEYTA
jgi:hypothetical protein